jgi:hypothetical protein
MSKNDQCLGLGRELWAYGTSFEIKMCLVRHVLLAESALFLSYGQLIYAKTANILGAGFGAPPPPGLAGVGARARLKRFPCVRQCKLHNLAKPSLESNKILGFQGQF